MQETLCGVLGSMPQGRPDFRHLLPGKFVVNEYQPSSVLLLKSREPCTRQQPVVEDVDNDNAIYRDALML